MNKYHRLNLLEREEISRGLAQNKSYHEIADYLGRHVSAISREIKSKGLNRKTYRANYAHKKAKKISKKHNSQRKISSNPFLQQYVFEKLRLHWSPEQIANQLKTEYTDDMTKQVSHETIYTYIYVLPKGTLKKQLLACLRQKRKYRRNRRKIQGILKQENRGKIVHMLSIEERPREVEGRIIPGHWEGDLIVGKYHQSVLGTLVERTTRLTILVPLKSADAQTVRKSFAGEMKKLPKQLALTLTYDQGREMAEHRLFTKDTKIKVYFAHPAHPWERGTNENTNGLIRDFFPKGTDFNKVSQKEIKRVQNLLNGRPRKVLNWRKPEEVFSELVALAT